MYNPELKSGYDLRDLLTDGNKGHQLGLLLSLLRPVPPGWFTDLPPEQEPEQIKVEPLECTSYAELVDAWSDTRDQPEGKKGALYWVESIDVAFCTLLALVASTKLQGAQLWLRMIGSPGSAKSTLCEALCACPKYIHRMGKQTGFHSGQGGKAIWPDINGKLVVFNEGDMLVSAPNRDSTLAEMRDSWTGVVTAVYRNGVSYTYKGLRIPYLVAGTNTLRQLDKSSAGDRFLDIIIYEKIDKKPRDKEERKLLRRAVLMEAEQSNFESDGTPESQDDPAKIYAYAKTAGFIIHLRETIVEKAAELVIPDKVVDHCMDLGELVACMRTRPLKIGDETYTEAELATRLGKQFMRLAKCLAVVLDKPTIDDEVMRRVALVARDTSKGFTFTICKLLAEKPMDVLGLNVKFEGRWSPQHIRNGLNTLQSIGCVKRELLSSPAGISGRTKHVFRLSVEFKVLLHKLQSLLHPKQPVANA